LDLDAVTDFFDAMTWALLSCPGLETGTGAGNKTQLPVQSGAQFAFTDHRPSGSGQVAKSATPQSPSKCVRMSNSAGGPNEPRQSPCLTLEPA
jgi:hypothetical protein